MKKQFILFSLVLASAATLSAQTKTQSKLGTSLKLSHADSIMCSKEWHLTSVEELSVVTKPPAEKNTKDMLLMTADKKYTAILSGKKSSGTWARSGQYIYFTDDTTGEKFNYKVIAVDEKKIKVDYRNSETHAVFEME